MSHALTNRDLSELLALRAEEVEGQRQRAYRRAARAAMYWPEEAAALVEQDLPLTDLHGIGPRLSGRIKAWLEDPPPVPEPPPSRAGFMTFARARAIVQANPEWQDGLRGDLQMHTHYSDGKMTVEEMAFAARDLGHEYVAITDHSVGLKIAGGMSADELAQQRREIDALNERLASDESGFTVLRSLEMNLDVEGRGDMEEVTADLDIVVGSFHSKLRGTEDQTERYVRALSNPTFQILGHPRCRMFNSRLGLHADWPVVFEAAASFGKAIELNAHPNRQDLNAEVIALAADSSSLFSIGTDAHAPWELEFVPMALAAAIEAGLDRDRIVNFMPVDELREWVARTRAEARGP
ncbi:MAG TPA: PHP domain-containing protein [Actinomycetota bacterium]